MLWVDMLKGFGVILRPSGVHSFVFSMLGMVGVIAWSVIGRQVFRLPVAWSEEIGAGLMAWMVLTGSAAAWYKRRHLIIDLVLRRHSPRWLAIFFAVIEVLSILLFAVLFWGALSMLIGGPGTGKSHVAVVLKARLRRDPRYPGDRTSPYPARTMPMLRRPDADRRDLQARAETAITGTVSGDGSMMECASASPICNRFQCRHRTHTDCPRPPEPAKMAVLHLDPAPCVSVASGKRPHYAQPSRPWTPPTIVAAPRRRLSFPIEGVQATAASSFRGLSAWTATLWWLASRSGPRRKTYRKAA